MNKISKIIEEVNIYGDEIYREGILRGRILELEVLIELDKDEHITHEDLKRWKEYYEMVLEMRKGGHK